MNEQSSKKILFNKSTLLSLKAELLRKKDEVHEKKRLPQNKIENFKPPASKSNEQAGDERNRNRDKVNTQFKDRLKAVDVEELEACRKAKAVLEKKAELYEHLTDQSGSSQLAGRFLVDFNTKKQQEVSVKESSPQPEESASRVESDNNDDDEEWVEFTDCLGRTRKCHKSDMDLYIKRDKQLLHAISKGQKVEDVEEPKATEKPLLVQQTNDYLQSLREKWEEKEQKLLSKDQDIHYQDLLFDEARMHGVAYYSFSTEEKERRKQMEELTRLRQQTLTAQAEAETRRLQQEEMMAARVAAARARRRERAGLPPEDPEESKKKYANLLLDFLNKQKNEADAKAKEEERKLKEEQEKERQKLRDAYIRDWDVGKEGVDEKIKKFKEMTQEEYVEQQRSKRIDEFAPPQSSSNQKSSCSFNLQGKILSDAPNTLTWGDVRTRLKTPPPPTISEDIDYKGLYFTTKKKDMKYKNFVKSPEPTPIVNELSDSEEEVASSSKGKKRYVDSGGTVIAPPPTYDYYGPVPKKSRPQAPFHSDIKEAYAQGAKSLESRPTQHKLSKDYDFSLE